MMSKYKYKSFAIRLELIKMKLSKLLLFSLLIYILAFATLPSTAAEGGDLMTNDDGDYVIRIEASQWEFKAFDLVHLDKLMADGMNEEDAMDELEIKHRIGSFAKGSHIVLKIVSRDVQHGFSINEVDVSIALNRPVEGAEFGSASILEFDAPTKNTIISAYCHVFCGLGHPDMKMKFVIGEGLPNYGLGVFWAVIALNTLIFGYTLRTILTQIQLITTEAVTA